MQIHIIAVGERMPEWVAEAYAECVNQGDVIISSAGLHLPEEGNTHYDEI